MDLLNKKTSAAYIMRNVVKLDRAKWNRKAQRINTWNREKYKGVTLLIYACIYLSSLDFFLEKKPHLNFEIGSKEMSSWERPRLSVPTTSPNSSNSCKRNSHWYLQKKKLKKNRWIKYSPIIHFLKIRSLHLQDSL